MDVVDERNESIGMNEMAKKFKISFSLRNLKLFFWKWIKIGSIYIYSSFTEIFSKIDFGRFCNLIDILHFI